MIDHGRAQNLVSPELANLLTSTCIYVWGRALDLRLAQDLAEQALAMFQRLYDGDHLAIATSQYNLAVDLRGAEEYELARQLDEQALAMRRRLLEGDHSHVAQSLNNLSGAARAR